MNNTQHIKILALLRNRKGWVPLPDILALGIAQYNARIHELREIGYDIQNKTEWVKGVRHSWFLLVSEPHATRQAFEDNKGQFAFCK